MPSGAGSTSTKNGHLWMICRPDDQHSTIGRRVGRPIASVSFSSAEQASQGGVVGLGVVAGVRWNGADAADLVDLGPRHQVGE